jgi:hypothetical protein
MQRVFGITQARAPSPATYEEFAPAHMTPPRAGTMRQCLVSAGGDTLRCMTRHPLMHLHAGLQFLLEQ